MANFTAVGMRRPRPYGMRLASGEGQYAGDLVLPHMLYGKVLRSPYAHARILNIDTSQAERLPGVKAVVTGKEILPRRFGPFADEYGLAIEKARYIGEPVAAVAAVDEDTAMEALELIKVEYEPLPAVFDPVAAMEPDAPAIHEGGNISNELRLEWGDVEAGFKEADYVREDVFRAPAVQHCAMEPHSAVAYWDASGQLHIWTANQGAFVKRRVLSVTLGIPESQVHIYRAYVGGGFGSKIAMSAGDFAACWLSRKAGRPVKIIYTREEVFTTTRVRHPMIIELKTGVKKDGTIVARECRLLVDNGAYNDTGPIAMYIAGTAFSTMYRIPNLRYFGRLVYTNKPTGGPQRGHGHVNLNFASESQLDMVAEAIGIDPMELRAKNAMIPNYELPSKHKISSCELKQSIVKAAEAIGWKEKRGKGREKKRGVGMACTSFINNLWLGPDTSSGAFVKVGYDGGVIVITGGADIGQGLDNIMAQIAAEELGIDVSEITVVSGDTAVCPSDVGAFASGETFTTGNAVRLAAADAKRQILEVAAEMMGVTPEILDIQQGQVIQVGSPENRLPVKDVIKRSFQQGKGIYGKANYAPKVDRPKYGDRIEGQYTPTLSYGAQAVEVEVDVETGEVKVLKVVDALDCGTKINPLEVEGQAEGSISMGLGQALGEELIWDEGQALNANFLNYRIPRANQMPDIEEVDVDSYEPLGPFGAKEVGESSAVPTAAAVANAVYDAIGVRIKELPITPEKILRALEEKEKSGA